VLLVLPTELPYKRRAAFNKRIKMGMVRSRISAEKGIDTQVMKKMAVLTSLRLATTMVETTITINNRESSSRFLK
jgi:hypothetical protein